MKKIDAAFGRRNWNNVPLRHYIANKIMCEFFNYLFKTDFDDITNGMSAYSKKSIRILLKEYKNIEIKPNGYQIEVFNRWALLVKHRLRCVQVDCDIKYKEKSGIIRGLKMVHDIMVYTLYLREIS